MKRDKDYIERAMNAYSITTSSNKIINITKDLLLSEAKDKSIFLSIKNIVIHNYSCKCIYSLNGYINGNSFDIVGQDKKLIDAFISIRGQIFGKYLR